MGLFTGPATRGLGGRKIFSRNSFGPPPTPSGNQVIFQIQGSTNSSGPYDQTVPTAMISGITVSPIPSITGVAPLGTLIPDPTLVNSNSLQVVGSVGDGPIWYYTVCLLGTVPQDHFTDMTFQTVGGSTVVLLSADANFNTLFTGVGFSIWAWEMPGTGLPPDLMDDNSDITITWP